MWDNSSSGNIPWKEILLSEVFELNHDQVFPALYPATPFVHYSIPSWDQTGGPNVELGEEIGSNKTLIYRPSVLVSKLNPRKPRVVPVYQPPPNTCCSTEFICYQPKRGEDDLRFWAGYFSSSTFSGRLSTNAIGSTNSHTRANPQETLSWYVPDVPQDEQQYIARILDTLDTTIRETEAIIAKLKAVKQGLLHDLLTRGLDDNCELRPPQSEAPHLYKQSPLGWIPQDWDFQQLGSVCEKIGDGVHTSVSVVPHGYPFLYVSCVRDGQILWGKCSFISEDTYQTVNRGKKIGEDTVLYTVVGSYGHAAVVQSDIKFSFQRHIAYLIPSEELAPEFLSLWLNSSFGRILSDQLALGNAQKTITLSVLSTMAILLAPRHLVWI